MGQHQGEREAVSEGVGEAVAGHSKATVDEGRKFPSEHEDVGVDHGGRVGEIGVRRRKKVFLIRGSFKSGERHELC